MSSINKTSIIVGGSGQFGITLALQLIKKKVKVIITTRNIKKTKKKFSTKNKYIKIIKLDVLKPKKIDLILRKYKPNFIYYFAGLSSPGLSFQKPRETYLSNYVGCKNFLENIRFRKINCKFLNANSCEIFAKTNKKLDISSKKKPISPYGRSKLLSFNLTKEFREKYNLKSYNAIIFNTESIYREKYFLIPKMCLAAIDAYKYRKKTYFGNLNISREWNWCEEQIKYMLHFLQKKPQDFLLSNQKIFSAKKMLEFAFKFFDLDYRKFVFMNKKYIRPNDFNIKKSNSKKTFISNNINYKYKVYGKKIIYKLIKYYLNESKY